jgi:Protein of unknown function (DUF2490)
MVQLSSKEGKLNIMHRFMLEQRFVGKYCGSATAKQDQYPLLHRMRYMMRLQMPLVGKEIKDNTPYAALYNEIFIGFGKNVNANVFDQNRVGVILGYRINKNVKLEAGFIHQMLQYGRQMNSKNIFQNNNGIIMNANYNF